MIPRYRQPQVSLSVDLFTVPRAGGILLPRNSNEIVLSSVASSSSHVGYSSWKALQRERRRVHALQPTTAVANQWHQRRVTSRCLATATAAAAAAAAARQPSIHLTSLNVHQFQLHIRCSTFKWMPGVINRQQFRIFVR